MYVCTYILVMGVEFNFVWKIEDDVEELKMGDLKA